MTFAAESDLLTFDRDATAQAVLASVGKRIASVELVADELRLAFTDGAVLRIYDDGQSCCESRYMRTDDDLPTFAGATLRGVEVRDATDIACDGEDSHEVAFLVVHTDGGDIVCSTHNEHNGYYGGFAMKATTEPDA